jgi:hypothetical protein
MGALGLEGSKAASAYASRSQEATMRTETVNRMGRRGEIVAISKQKYTGGKTMNIKNNTKRNRGSM